MNLRNSLSRAGRAIRMYVCYVKWTTRTEVGCFGVGENRNKQITETLIVQVNVRELPLSLYRFGSSVLLAAFILDHTRHVSPRESTFY